MDSDSSYEPGIGSDGHGGPEGEFEATRPPSRQKPAPPATGRDTRRYGGGTPSKAAGDGIPQGFTHGSYPKPVYYNET